MADADFSVVERVLEPAPQPVLADRLSLPPANFRFSGEDHLRVTSYNSLTGVTIAIQGRLQGEDGQIRAFAFAHTPNTDRSARSQVLPMPPGYLLNVALFAGAGSPILGQTYARLQVVRGFSGALTVLGTLVQDYLTSGQDIAWPGSPIRNAAEGAGYQRTIEGATVALGAEISETVPTGASWEIALIEITLTTSAAAATRFPHLILSDAGTDLYASKAWNSTPASTAQQYFWAHGVARNDSPAVGTFGWLAPLPQPALLRGGQSWGTVTDGLQAGDQYGRPHYLVRERLEAA